MGCGIAEYMRLYDPFDGKKSSRFSKAAENGKVLHRLSGAKAVNIPRLLPDFCDTHKNDKNRVDFSHAVLHKAAHELTATWRAIRDHPVRRDRKAKLGGVSEWLKETDCKSVRLAYAGSNPASSTIFVLTSRAGVAQW